MLKVDKTFETLGQFALWCDEVGGHAKEQGEDYGGWAGLATFKQALEFAVKGWPEGANKANKLATQVGNIAARRVVQNEPFFDTSGLEIDMGAYTAGVPECWLETQEVYRPAEGGVVTITLDASVSGSVTNDQLTRRGIAVAAAVSALETAGRSVELWVHLPMGEAGAGYKYGAKPDAAVLGRVCVKRAGQPLDLSVVSFACANPAMLRRLGFAFLDWCASSEGVERVGHNHSYGYPSDTPKEYRGDIAAPAVLTGSGMSEEAMLAWIDEALQSQGVQVKG